MCCKSAASDRDGERDDDQDACDCECDPHAGGNGLGTRRCDVDRRRCEREHSAHNGCTGDEAEIARQVEHAGNDAEAGPECRGIGRSASARATKRKNNKKRPAIEQRRLHDDPGVVRLAIGILRFLVQRAHCAATAEAPPWPCSRRVGSQARPAPRTGQYCSVRRRMPVLSG